MFWDWRSAGIPFRHATKVPAPLQVVTSWLCYCLPRDSVCGLADLLLCLWSHLPDLDAHSAANVSRLGRPQSDNSDLYGPRPQPNA